MPYFIFKVSGERQFEYLEAHDTYREARRVVRALRQSASSDPGIQYRMVHGGDPASAERLLAMPREPRPLGEDA